MTCNILRTYAKKPQQAYMWNNTMRHDSRGEKGYNTENISSDKEILRRMLFSFFKEARVMRGASARSHGNIVCSFIRYFSVKHTLIVKNRSYSSYHLHFMGSSLIYKEQATFGGLSVRLSVLFRLLHPIAKQTAVTRNSRRASGTFPNIVI